MTSLFIFIFLNIIFICYTQRISPFSRIKMLEDDIFFTLGLGPTKESQWHKLLSIESIGADAIVKYAKEHYGINMCDFKIQCYKYNIIVNFDTIFNLMTNKNEFPRRLGLEYELENKIQNGVDVEATYEKFKRNQENLEVNIKLSKSNREKVVINLNKFISKGFNKLKNTFNNLFRDGEESLTKNSTYLDSKSSLNLRKEISEMKNEIKHIEKEEEKIEKNLISDIQKINSALEKEKSILDNIWKTEIIAGIVGAILVFSILAVYYVCNGLLKTHKIKKSIN